MTDWKTLKTKIEKRFSKQKLWDNCYGFQVQPGTCWKDGLSEKEIKAIEDLFGFRLPLAYKEMLGIMPGFDREMISIDPEGRRSPEFSRGPYEYPEDYEKTTWLREEIQEYRSYTDEVLLAEGFDPGQVTGFVPLYAHRALVAFKDTSLSPVISVHQGTDVVMYGRSLPEYWKNEFLPPW